ncbi:MAG: M48 family metallopeptidase [Zoogloeaceae bacterium]|jgi:predicted metal-dependent hydrolase|nr:M48 family metallopeptidase [Zoogloeaceae bacterium]
MKRTQRQLDLSLGGAPAKTADGQYSLQFDAPPLPFRLRRSRHDKISLHVDEQGLQVNAPRGMTLPQIEQAIRDGSRAIVGKLAGRAAGPGKLPLPARWQDGARFPFLGRDITLCLDGRHDGIALRGERLHLPLPPEAGEKQIKDSVQGWLQTQAQRVIAEQLAASCRHLGLPAPAWRLSFAAGAWGGVDADGRLRLSWRLIHLSPEEIGSVVRRFLSPRPAAGAAPTLWQDDAAAVPA